MSLGLRTLPALLIKCLLFLKIQYTHLGRLKSCTILLKCSSTSDRNVNHLPAQYLTFSI